LSITTFDTVLAFAAAMLTLSLLVTAWVQFLSALLQLRAGNLVWGLERLLQQIDPKNELGSQTRALAEHLVKKHRALAGASILRGLSAYFAKWGQKHPWLGRLALAFDRFALFAGQGSTAIRPGELVIALRELATPKPAGTGGPDVLPQDVQTALTQWLESIDHSTDGAGLVGKIGAVADEVGKLLPAETKVAVREAVERAVKQGDALARRVGDWFDTVMDRTAERFALQCRYVTVLGAAILVLALGVDAEWMFSRLKTDTAQREALIGQVDPLLKRASASFEQNCAGTAASEGLQALGKDQPALAQALKASPPGELASVSQARAWLAKAGVTVDDAVLRKAHAEAARACITTLQGDLAAARAATETHVDALLRGPICKVEGSWSLSCKEGAPHWRGHLLAFVLLSLGAPFWFNALKTLSSLRPLVASRAETPK